MNLKQNKGYYVHYIKKKNLCENSVDIDKILEASHDGLVVFGNKMEIVLSKGILVKKISKEVWAFIREMCEKVISSGNKITGLRQAEDSGQYFLVTANPVFNKKSKEKASHVVCNIRDIRYLNTLKKEIEHLSLSMGKHSSSIEWDNEWDKHKEELKKMVCRSAAMRNILTSALRVAQVDSTVLILGESGVGKDMLANLIHRVGKRKDLPFIKISCNAIPEHLLESELFGYEGGAFTGARKEGKKGLFELAANGTIFLDEIGELPPSLQVKLLNVLQDGTFLRIGGLKPLNTSARLIAATNQDLEKRVQEGKFRADLFYRLYVIPITIPSLRTRRGDILPLIQHFLEFYNKHHGFKRSLSPMALDYLIKYDWPGNVRELQNVIEFLVVMVQEDIIDIGSLPDQIIESVQGVKLFRSGSTGKMPLKEAIEEYERDLINYALAEHGTLREAAESLGIDLSTLTRKRQKHGLKKRK